MNAKTKKLIFGIFLITIACYANTLNAGFVWDDLNNVVNSERIAVAEGFNQIFLNPSAGFYRPLSYLSIKLDYLLWGYNSAGYHLSNIIIHLLNSIMVFLIIRLFGVKSVDSFLAAVLFSVHPVHTEAVAYISGRSDTVAALFILISFYFFIKFLNKHQPERKHPYRNFLYCGSLLAFSFALLSKEIALLFPILILGYLFISCDDCLRKKIKYSVSFFIIGISFILFREHILQGELLFPESQPGQIYDVFKILFSYISLMIVPINLHMQRSLLEFTIFYNMPFWISLLVFLTMVYVITKYARTKTMYLGLFWFGLWLFPFLGLLQYSAELAEHWLYIPSVGIFIILGRQLTIKNNIFLRKAAVIVILIMAVLTIRQNNVWHDDMSLYKHTLNFKPDDAKLNYNLGNAYLRRNMLVESEIAYLMSLKIEPDYAYALNNLGIVYERQGMMDSAIRLYKAANAVETKEDYAHNNIMRFLSQEEAFAQDTVQTFDHSAFGQLLLEYLDDGWVDYKRLKKTPFLLYRYIAKLKNLERVDFEKFSKKEKQAIYINAYNAFTIKAILDHYPVESIKKIPGVWKKLKFNIAGKIYTLDEIEHSILRPVYKDPRVHFALVCAAQGCPRLNTKIFTAEDMDEMLDAAGENFLNDTTRNSLDKEKNVLYLSSIFKWFKKDFGDIIEFISKYMNEEDIAYIRANNPKIKYQYNWKLNEKK